MDITTYFSQLQDQLKKDLNALNGAQSDKVTAAALRLNVIIHKLDELRQFIYSYHFKDTIEEIKFFKEQKPVVLSQYFFQKNVYRTSLVTSFMPADKKTSYYRTAMNRLSKFANRHQSFILYCMSGATSQDQLYFTRSGTIAYPWRDPRFSTGYDEKLARILANALLKEFMTKQLTFEEKAGTLSWTGKKLDLVELIFALHATGSINNADTSVKPIADAFEKLFNVDLGNYHDYLQAIRSRKKSRLVFLDKLKLSLQSKFDDMDVR